MDIIGTGCRVEEVDAYNKLKQFRAQQLCFWGWWRCWTGDSEEEEIGFELGRVQPAAASPQAIITPPGITGNTQHLSRQDSCSPGDGISTQQPSPILPQSNLPAVLSKPGQSLMFCSQPQI